MEAFLGGTVGRGENELLREEHFGAKTAFVSHESRLLIFAALFVCSFEITSDK